MRDEFDDIPLRESDDEYGGVCARDLVNIIRELDGSEELQKIFGLPVSDRIFVVADENILRIETDMEDLTDEQNEVFLRVLDDAIEKQVPGGRGG